MIPDHARKRLDVFSKVLRNAGLGEAAAARVHELATAYESERGGPPAAQEEIVAYVKSKRLATEREQRQSEAFLGAYLVFNDPSMGFSVSSLIQGLLTLDTETAIARAQKTLEGEGPLGRLATKMIGFFTRETVRQWLAPIGAIAIVVVAFLENPTVIFMRILSPSPSKATRKLDHTDAAVQSAKREAAMARDLMKVVARRWNQAGSPTLADLALLSAAPADFDPLVQAYDLDSKLWPATGKVPPPEIVLRGRTEPRRIILAAPDSITVIDLKFVIAVEGYR